MMSRKKKYNTEQRQLILEYMQKHCESQITASGLFSELDGENIGRSTLYRQLEELVEEGKILRSVQQSSRTYVYSLANCDCAEHYHLKCALCGRVVHLDKSITTLMQSSLKENDFETDEVDTMLIGKCSRCKVKKD